MSVKLFMGVVMSCFIGSGFTTDTLQIRHGRSRVRHTTEKDHIRWGLRAFDNLTLLDYDYDGSNDTSNDTNRYMYANSTSSNEFMAYILPSTERSTDTQNRHVTKKKIMANIELNVLKGIEYLRRMDQQQQMQRDAPDVVGPLPSQSRGLGKSYQTPTLGRGVAVGAVDASGEKNKTAINETEVVDVDAADKVETLDESTQAQDDVSRQTRLHLLKGRDVLTQFLEIVETQHLLGANCTAGTALNLGDGVVDQYAQDRFRVEAEVAVNRANMLTRIFKLSSPAVQASEHLLHASVLSMVEFDDDIFAAGNCFDYNQHPLKRGLFCPFAYRLPASDHGATFAKDLAAEYDYLGNTSEWFFAARRNAEKVIKKNEQYITAYHLYSNSSARESDRILYVRYEDGRWSKPYYDCGGGNIWMLTYTVPFFGYENDTYFFKGTSGIDIDLRRVDIDQCATKITPGTQQPLNLFAGTDKCKQRTTECEAIPGLGFRRGSYRCVCRRGYYFPDTEGQLKFFNGSTLEEEYEKLLKNESSTYNKEDAYECLPCAEGCDACRDASPCVAALNWPMRTSILVLACTVIGLLPPAAWFTFRYQQVKVVRAASPALLRVIALGAFFIYCTSIVMYPNPSLYTCTARVWLREIGFSLTYGALMLKTWRISVIFRVRSAKAVKITDAALLKRLGAMCGAVAVALLVRTIVSPPLVVVGRTADDLKAFLCKTDWWDHTFTSMEVLFLAWGVRLCIVVRKAPSEFNESRFISMAIYNEFLLTCFLNVSMLFLQSPANPDLLYIIFFCHTQLTVTLLLALIFGSKVYLVFRNGGAKAHEFALGLSAGKGTSAGGGGNKFICRTSKTLTVPGGHSGGGPLGSNTMPSSLQQTAALTQYANNDYNQLSEAQALDQIRQLYAQLTSQGVVLLAGIIEKQGQPPVPSNAIKMQMIDKSTYTDVEYFALHVDSLECMCSDDHDSAVLRQGSVDHDADVVIDNKDTSDTVDSVNDIGNGHLPCKSVDCNEQEEGTVVVGSGDQLHHEGNNHCVSNCKILDEKRPTPPQRLDLNDRSKYTKEVSV